MVGDLWASDPAAELRVALAQLTGNPMAIGAEDADCSIDF